MQIIHGCKYIKTLQQQPIYSQYFTTTSGNINFTGLAQGYYYFKVFTYYNGKGQDFSSYSIVNTYTQVNIAAIKITSIDSTPSCDSTNSITYTLSKSHAPYKVQLYRFGLPYGSAKSVTTTKAVFSNLPSGVYYATVFGDGATGLAFGKSSNTVFMPSPQNPVTTAIKAKQATLTWSAVSCADYYTIQARKVGTTTWSTFNTNGKVTSYVWANLLASTSYEWHVASVDSANGIAATSLYSATVTFKTPASFASEDAESMNAADKLNDVTGNIFTIAPNPANSFFTIHYNGNVKGKLIATLYSANGKTLWASGAISAESLNGKQVMVNSFESGLYFLRITDADRRT